LKISGYSPFKYSKIFQKALLFFLDMLQEDLNSGNFEVLGLEDIQSKEVLLQLRQGAAQVPRSF